MQTPTNVYRISKTEQKETCISTRNEWEVLEATNLTDRQTGACAYLIYFTGSMQFWGRTSAFAGRKRSSKSIILLSGHTAVVKIKNGARHQHCQFYPWPCNYKLGLQYCVSLCPNIISSFCSFTLWTCPQTNSRKSYGSFLKKKIQWEPQVAKKWKTELRPVARRYI